MNQTLLNSELLANSLREFNDVVLVNLKCHTLLNQKWNHAGTLYQLCTIRRNLCTGRQPIVNRVVAQKATDWSKFCKGVKQGIQLACVRCLNAEEILMLNIGL